ncbi:MAG: hypothetical protein QXF76_00400 [Candidatus Anstonellales archaeon]
MKYLLNSIRVFSFGIFLALVFFSSINYSINIQPCEDGTPYYNCSIKNPGYLCLASGLVFDDRPNGCCSKLGGTIQSGECIIKCPDGTLHGQCSTSQQYGAPYYCNMGKLEKDPNKCPCPENYERKGNDCVLKTGCAYNNPPCQYDQVCNKITNQCIDICDRRTEVYNNKTGKCEPRQSNVNTSTSSTQQNQQQANTSQSQREQVNISANISALFGEVGSLNTNKPNNSGASASSSNCCGTLFILIPLAFAPFAIRFIKK